MNGQRKILGFWGEKREMGGGSERSGARVTGGENDQEKRHWYMWIKERDEPASITNQTGKTVLVYVDIGENTGEHRAIRAKAQRAQIATFSPFRKTN